MGAVGSSEKNSSFLLYYVLYNFRTHANLVLVQATMEPSTIWESMGIFTNALGSITVQIDDKVKTNAEMHDPQRFKGIITFS